MAQLCDRLLEDAVDYAESEVSGHAVGGAAHGAGACDDGREAAGRCGGLEVHAEARYAHRLGEVPAERGRGGRQQEQIRALVHCVAEPLAQFGDERGRRTHQLTLARDAAAPPRVGGETAELQPGAAYEGCEDVRGGEGDVVPRLTQCGAQARVGRDVAARSGRGDQNPHWFSSESESESVPPPARRAALAWTALRV
ncbi:hypothetical protein GCM10020000_78390 [Streptomyces olivoverticillatus]